MNSPKDIVIPDIQSTVDDRQIAIDKVGIKSIRYPVSIAELGGGVQKTVANFDMYVGLPKDKKGTHMSRFVEILNQFDSPFSSDSFKKMLDKMVVALEANSGEIKMEFPFFIEKAAPVSKVKSLMDYQATFFGHVLKREFSFAMKVVVPVKSLCPCSKEISDYGAHNQRSHVTINATLSQGDIWIEDLVKVAEEEASCELFGLLKRPDEKYVTERAYDNPKFVEDLVRDISVRLDKDQRISGYSVESENFESIHNHSAYALVRK
ncbi:MAG: GTP cyclohydrolase I FolE2 [Proteobacteria bacterium]|nr:GTP cyclohydrolase I FolE2 [Pseudomonadota bacterium]